MLEISAVISTHNRPELLERALASVRAQTYPASEIIVVDDASDSAVAERIRGDVHVVRRETPGGPAIARNAGAAVASGTHVAFLDDDDVWTERKLEKVVRALEAFPRAGAAFHRLGSCDEVGRGAKGFALLSDPVARMLELHPPHPSTLVVALAVHQEVRFDGAYEASEDLDYNVRLSEATAVVEILDTLACTQPRKESPTAISIATRIQARERFRAQHARLFTDERFERHHQMQLAHLHRRAGHRAEAVWRFASLIRKSPTDVPAWKGMFSSVLPLSCAGRIGARWRRITD